VARIPGLPGVCLADWRPYAGGIRVTTTKDPRNASWGRVTGADGIVRMYTRDFRLPELGFALPDRLVSLRRDGIDPVDVPPAGARMPPISLASPPSLAPTNPTGITRPDVPDQRYLRFANGLLERLRKTNTGLPAWAVTEAGAGRNEPKPAAQTVLFSVTQGTPFDYPALLLPLPEKGKPAREGDPFVSLPPIVRVFTGMPRMSQERGQAIVFDFRDRPEELDEALQWLVPPGTVPAGQQPWVARESGRPDGGEPVAAAPERMDG